MGHGGHHGGGHHGGSHHSGGGHFSGSRGGGHYSSGVHYSSGYYGGGYYGGGSNSGANKARLIITLIYGGCVYNSLCIMTLMGEVPGMNFLNLLIYHVAAVFFILGIVNYRRTSSVRKIRNGVKVALTDEVRRGRKTSMVKGYEICWVGTADSSYRIYLSDNYYGKRIREEIKESVSRGAGIVWMNQYLLMVVGIVTFFATMMFYELIIPIFENMYMDDILFKFVDDLVFYLPSWICLAASVICFVTGKIRDKILYKCAVRLVKIIEDEEKKRLTEAQISSKMQMKWYYLICPNCGASYPQVYYNCIYCGSSMEVTNPNVINGPIRLT